MLNLPPQEVLDALPRLYGTAPIPLEEKVIHLHFFFRECDWYAAEFDGEDEFFGYACLGDPALAEWGYFSLTELKSIQTEAPVMDAHTRKLIGWLPVFVEWDELWQPKPFHQIE